MNKLILAVAFTFFINQASDAQTIQGKVVDAENGDPIAYVHIGISGYNKGSISRDDGLFSIDISGIDPNEKLWFSILGYKIHGIPLTELKEGKFLAIQLIPKVYELKNVDVTASRIKDKQKPVKLGRYIPTKSTYGQSGYKEFGFGGEYGLQIFNDSKKYYLSEVTMHMKVNTVDSILFRFNIYKVENGLPGESFLNQEVFTKAYKKDKWISADLKPFNLVMDQNLIVTYEVVRIWFSENTNNAMFFTRGVDYDRGGTFVKRSSMDRWSIVDSPETPGMITMYLTGYDMEK